ncbi:type II toxin-antitoxin system Phd/YefM family antitoxin [Lentilactobacillus raoultii]|uniref:Antitoxin n=1 Tax=Lentilactobacillus raoultii TaxID=1987503 RepID=A0ABW3PLP6_9LACO|nr:type II toxin-antitoxin system Phd/YefM family antitoxin [Lentilactobacillus raoultii]
MKSVTYSDFRRSLKVYLKQASEDSESLIVTNEDTKDNVVMSKRDYDAMVETMRIMSNPYLMKKIKAADRQFNSGHYQEHQLIEDSDK